MKAHVLIIEDDREIGELIGLYLDKEGITSSLYSTAEEGLLILQSGGFDLLILDINLPGIDGFEALRELRKKKNIPVVIVSARDTDEDLILGLGLGADDFVTKPFSPKVLVARVRAHLRRFYDAGDSSLIRFGNFTLDPEGALLKKNGKRVSIPPKELELLFLLAQNPGVTMTPEEIYSKVWGVRYGDVTTVAVHIQRLRRKIEEDPASPRFIETIRGFGYRFNP
jgi:DNA-binding response OmpR family regulator